MRKPKVVILNITHGDNPYMDQPPFLPIAAGACRSDITNDACGEDNISDKNKWYGDFTSLYWAWKNLKDVDIIGTSHYRRYFVDVNYMEDSEYVVSWDQFKAYNYSTSPFVRDLKKFDFVLMKTWHTPVTIKEQYLENHPYPEILEEVDAALEKIHPEAVDVWHKYLNSNDFIPGFLFMTTWQNFVSLCQWLYPVLSEIEMRIDIQRYKDYQERVIGFIYERLVPVYILLHAKKVKTYPIFKIGEENKRSIKQIKRQAIKKKIKNVLHHIKKVVSFK